MIRHAALACLAILSTLPPVAPALAQTVPVPRLPGEAAPAPEPSRIPSHCIALAQGPTARLHRAAFGDPLAQDSIRLHYIGHASFALETAGGLTAVTDYTGFTGTRDFIPDVVTMNNAHSTHYTRNPDPRIPHVLPGWEQDGQPREHELELGEMLVRNVPTDVRGMGGIRPHGNSIFVFEVAGLCIGHLGHLHHEPGPEDYAMLGRLDVVMVPVDGGYTMDVAVMADVIRRLRSSVIIPMHWFSYAGLERFITEMGPDFAVQRAGGPAADLSLAGLPSQPTILVLDPQAID